MCDRFWKMKRKGAKRIRRQKEDAEVKTAPRGGKAGITRRLSSGVLDTVHVTAEGIHGELRKNEHTRSLISCFIRQPRHWVLLTEAVLRVAAGLHG